MPISGDSGVIGCRWMVRSATCAAMAIPAARNAIRMTFSAGNHACGDSSRMAVNATSAQNATLLPDAVATARDGARLFQAKGLPPGRFEV